jgi:hypothetical protein
MTQEQKKPMTAAMRRVLIAVSTAVGLVIVAPVLLSSQDLYSWGRTGLGLDQGWAVLVPASLDFAAVACIGMTIVAAWRREHPGVFELLVWTFAGASAYAQYTHGMTATVRATAPDAFWAFPMFAVLGPVLLHVTLSRVRKWAREDAGDWGWKRWIPGVAFRESLRAWAAGQREGITSSSAQVAYVRSVAAIRSLSGADALRYAFRALGSYDVYPAQTWLEARHRVVTQADIDEATAGRPRSPLPIPSAAPVSPAPAGILVSREDQWRASLDACRTKADRIRYAFAVAGNLDQAAAGAWLRSFGFDHSRAEINRIAQSMAPGAAPWTQDTDGFPTVPATRINGHSHELVTAD